MHGKPSNRVAFVLVVGFLALTLAGCGKREAQSDTVKSAPSSAAKPAAVAVPKKYAYDAWSDWQLDCNKRASDINAPCAAVRKRVCQVEGTQEGVACEMCGGQCREVVDDDTSLPRHFYAAWSEWRSGCNLCDAVPKVCKAERTRSCLDRMSGRGTDCEFCGGACKEQEDRTSTCSAECKSTVIVSYKDDACTIPSKDDIFAGPWGPQTGSPFNSGCSETQPNDKCVKFGRHYYKWGLCTAGCTPAMPK